MKILKDMTKKFLSLLMILGVSFSIVSCKSELKDATYTPDNNNISFAAANSSFALEGQDIAVNIQRGVADQAVTVNLTLNDPKGVYTLATPSITFDAGSYSKVVTLKYDINKLKPVEAYNFILSFNEADKSISGYATFTGKASVPLEYEDYGTISCAKGNFMGLIPAEKRSYKLQLAKYTTNYYKIVGIYGGTENLEFNIKDGLTYITSPEISYYTGSADVKDYPMYKIVTAANHASYGIMTAWIDSEPQYSTWTGLSVGDKAIVGSRMSMDAYYTVSAGYFGWYTDEFQVTAVK